MNTARKKRRWGCLVFAGIVLAGYGYMLVASRFAKYYAWNSCGPIQVLARKGEVWLFMQIDREVRHPGRACDGPTVYPVGHLQDVVVLSKCGISQRTRVASQDGKCGVSFHPNLSFIYHDRGRLLLFTSQSMNKLDSLFEWHDRFFLLLPLPDAQEVARSYKPDFFSGQPCPSLSELTRKDGWDYIASDRTFGNGFSFKALGHEFRLIVEEGDPEFTVRIESDMFEQGKSAVILNYPNDRRVLTLKEYKALPRREYGHPRPKR